MMKWLKHAFAIEPPGPAEPTPEQAVVIDRLCADIVRRGLTTPALVTLESFRPMNYVGAQVMHGFAPFVAALASTESYNQVAAFLEKRGSVDYLLHRLEELEETEAVPPGGTPGTSQDSVSPSPEPLR